MFLNFKDTDGVQRRSQAPTVVAAYARRKELSAILY
jgi:hypothetical protein